MNAAAAAGDLNEFTDRWLRFEGMPAHVLGRHIAKGNSTAIAVGVNRDLPSAWRATESPAPTAMPPAEGLLTTAQAARYLGVSERSVTRAVRRGALKARRLGRLVRFRRNDLDLLAER